MKKFCFVLGVLLSFGMFYACGSDDDMNDIRSGGTVLVPEDSLADDSLKYITVDDHPGRLFYSEYLKTWIISYFHPGSIDGVDGYYPMNLPDEFVTDKEEEINVLFSGKVVEMTDEDMESLQIPRLGGHHYYFLYLTKIEKTE